MKTFNKYISWIFAIVLMFSTSYYLIFYHESLIVNIIGIIFALLFLYFFVRDVIIKKKHKMPEETVISKHKKVTVIEWVFIALIAGTLIVAILLDKQIIIAIFIIVTLISVNVRDYRRKKKENIKE